MSNKVRVTDGELNEFTDYDADGWSVDEGYLHVQRELTTVPGTAPRFTPVASYAPGFWSRIELIEENENGNG